MKQEIKEVEQDEEVIYFSLQEILPIGMTFIVLGIGLAYGLSVMSDVRDDMTDGSKSELAANQTIDAVAKIPAKLGLIVTIVVAVIIIGLLIRYLLVRF